MKTLKTSLLLLTILCMTLTACQNDPVITPDDEADYLTVQVAATTQSEFDEVYQIVDEAMQEAGLYGKTSTLCAAVTLDTVAQLVTVDFGTGCTGPDGRERSGVIKIAYIGRDRAPGSQMSISFVNYEVEGYQLGGALTVQTLARNSQGQLTFSYDISNGQLTYPDGTTVSYASVRTITWVAGEGSGDPSDDVFHIEGNSTGTNKDGDSYSALITQPIEVKTACLSDGYILPASGMVTVSTTLLPSAMTVDFGDGTCDSELTVTYRNKTKVIEL